MHTQSSSSTPQSQTPSAAAQAALLSPDRSVAYASVMSIGGVPRARFCARCGADCPEWDSMGDRSSTHVLCHRCGWVLGYMLPDGVEASRGVQRKVFDPASAGIEAVLFEARAIAGHGGPMTVEELSAVLRERRLREHEAAHARWAAHQLAERAALEAEYESYADSELHRIMVRHALQGTMFRDSAANVLHRRAMAARRHVVEAVLA